MTLLASCVLRMNQVCTNTPLLLRVWCLPDRLAYIASSERSAAAASPSSTAGSKALKRILQSVSLMGMSPSHLEYDALVGVQPCNQD